MCEGGRGRPRRSSSKRLRKQFLRSIDLSAIRRYQGDSAGQVLLTTTHVASSTSPKPFIEFSLKNRRGLNLIVNQSHVYSQTLLLENTHQIVAYFLGTTSGT